MKKRNLALVELTLVILFMALSAAVLVQVFAAARIQSSESRAQTVGQTMAQDLIERWKAGEDPAALFASDEGWQAMPAEELAGVSLEIQMTGEAGAENATDAEDAAAQPGQPDEVPAPTAGYTLWLDQTFAPMAGREGASYALSAALGTQPEPAGQLRRIAVRMTALNTGHELIGFATARYQSNQPDQPAN